VRSPGRVAYGRQAGFVTGRRRYSVQEKETAVRLVRESGRTSIDVGTELGIHPGTLARWVRAEYVERRGRDQANRVRPHFDYLTGHGFTLTDVSGEDWWAVTVTYRSAVSAVVVALNFEYERVELSLLRLVDGQIPAYPIFIVDSVPVDRFLADWLWELRGDSRRQPPTGLQDVEVDTQLEFWATVLRNDGADFLERRSRRA
jgi:transposase-like protein